MRVRTSGKAPPLLLAHRADREQRAPVVGLHAAAQPAEARMVFVRRDQERGVLDIMLFDPKRFQHAASVRRRGTAL